MFDHIVIGGGFAGLSAAVHLSSKGKKVELIESSQKLGGRAYSLADRQTNTIIDNGQHIMMGCYKDTLNFFRMIGAEDNLIFQERLQVNFLLPHLELVPLRSISNIYPFNLAIGLLNYKALSIKNRLSLLRFFLKLLLLSEHDLNGMTIADWLNMENQNNRILKSFWEILTAGALNTSIRKASARIFRDVLIEIFYKGNKASTIILPKYGLTESYCNNARNYIEQRDGKISTGEQVNKFLIKEGSIRSIMTSKRILTDFKYVITSVPYYGLKRILPYENIVPDPGFNYSSILTVHIWLKENHLKKTFYGLIGSGIHWIFNHGTHLTLVRSDADELIEKNKEELIELVKSELYNYCLIEEKNILDFRIIKEKRATFIPSDNILDKRPGPVTSVKNLILAGDWTDTGLPSTIESAVKSGRIAAEACS